MDSSPTTAIAPTAPRTLTPHTRKTLLLSVLLVAHSAVTSRALMEQGYLDLFRHAFSSWPTFQIFSDLTVGMVLVTSWMIADGRKNGRRVWPYILATLLVGSFGPLVYLFVGQLRSHGRAPSN